MRLSQLIAPFLLLASTACGGADKPVTEPTAPQPEPPAAVAAGGHLTIVPFVMTTTGTKPDGTQKVRVIRGDADGVISVEEDGATKNVAKVSADGTFAKLDGDQSETLRIDEAGMFHINGEPFPDMRIGADGTLFLKDEAVLRIEGGTVIDITGKWLKSSVTFNGNTQTTTFEIVVEGGDEARQLVGAMLGLQMLPGKVEDQSSPSDVKREAEPVVAP